MDRLKDRRVILAVGGGLALAAGLGIAAWLVAGGKDPDEAPPASQGGLIVQTGRDDDVKLDPTHPLRCFVGGQLAGEMTVAACAARNGVAAGALDVGVDTTGALSGSTGQPTAQVAPLPPMSPDQAQADAPAGATPVVAKSAGRSGVQACWRYSGGSWARLAPDMSLDDCVQTLYAGQCVRAGGAAYGRWNDRTLRLTDGRVETSPDNRAFHTLAEQGPDCSVAPLG